MLQQRAWCFSSNDNGSAVFLAFWTAKDFLDILDPFHFCRGNPQFLTDNLFPDDFHRSIAVGAVPVLVRHCTWDFDHRQSCQDLFPGSLRFPCLAVITTDGFFQSWSGTDGSAAVSASLNRFICLEIHPCLIFHWMTQTAFSSDIRLFH